VAVIGLIDVAALRRIRRIRFRDYALALVALAGVLLLGVLQACWWPSSSPCSPHPRGQPPNDRPLDMLRRAPEAGAYTPRLFHELDDAVAAFADPRTSSPPSA
jgi:hypothetical protein